EGCDEPLLPPVTAPTTPPTTPTTPPIAPPSTPPMGPAALLPSRAPFWTPWATCAWSIPGTLTTSAPAATMATAPTTKRNRDFARATGLVLIIIWSPWLNQKAGPRG